jgi:hypothetical protein
VPPSCFIGTGDDPLLPGYTSLTSLVPAAVPSLKKGSAPVTPSSPRNMTPAPNAVIAPAMLGNPEPAPGLRSLTSPVPAAVPSLT